MLIAVCLAAGKSLAHDFWLESTPYYTQPGEAVDVSVHVGNEFVGDSLPNIVSWYTDFSHYFPDHKQEVEGELGRDPAGYIKSDVQGTHLIGYQSDFTYTEIDPETFNKYLRMEGLSNAIEYRARHGLTDKPAKENYIRHAKTLIQVGDRFDIDTSMQRIGYDLEIMPAQNPYRLKLNDQLSLQVLYQGKPDAGLLLIAFSKQHPQRMQEIRTDADGRATITLDDTGPWLVKAVKIYRLERQQAEWQSHWASLTFGIR